MEVFAQVKGVVALLTGNIAEDNELLYQEDFYVEISFFFLLYELLISERNQTNESILRSYWESSITLLCSVIFAGAVFPMKTLCGVQFTNVLYF